MKVFVVSYQAEGESLWYLEAVVSTPEKAEIEIDALLKVGAMVVRVEGLELDGTTDDQIVVEIHVAGVAANDVTKH